MGKTCPFSIPPLRLVIFIAGLIMGAIIQNPGGSTGVFVQGSLLVLITAGLTIVVVTPFALFASIGRGYLLPVGLAVLMLMMTNFVAVAGWDEYFPWAVPGFFAQGKNLLLPVSYWIACLTGLAGILATYYWWKYAGQNR
jgi:ABC-2 type transport system permease protein